MSFLTPVLVGSVRSAVVSDLVSLRRAAAAPLRKELGQLLEPVDELAVRRRELGGRLDRLHLLDRVLDRRCLLVEVADDLG